MSKRKTNAALGNQIATVADKLEALEDMLRDKRDASKAEKEQVVYGTCAALMSNANDLLDNVIQLLSVTNEPK